MKIRPLADHPEHVATIGRWHWEEWGHADPGGSLESWTEGIASRTRRDSIPTTFIALDGVELMGSVCIVEFDMDTRKDLKPWVAGLLVAPEYRKQGVGSALMKEVMSFAANIGLQAESLYMNLGWSTIDNAIYEGEHVAIMASRVA